jgi:hypothetical protein
VPLRFLITYIFFTLYIVVHRHFPWFKLKIGVIIFSYCVYMPCLESAPHKVTMNHIFPRSAIREPHPTISKASAITCSSDMARPAAHADAKVAASSWAQVAAAIPS